MRYYFLSYLIPLLFLLSGGLAASEYHEQLNLKPLPQSSLLASFQFRSNTSLSQFEAHNFRYFPRSLGQILQHVGTRELHLRFSLGRWDAESWGARPWDGTKEGGTGVELWAWLEADTEEQCVDVIARTGCLLIRPLIRLLIRDLGPTTNGLR